MSFDLFFQVFRKGACAGVSASKARALFPIIEDESDDDLWRVQYDDGDLHELDVSFLDDNPASITSLSISAPPADPRFWDAIFSLLKMSNGAIYYPDGPGPIVGREETISHLPPDMIESMGQPIVVGSGSAIRDRVEL